MESVEKIEREDKYKGQVKLGGDKDLLELQDQIEKNFKTDVSSE